MPLSRRQVVVTAISLPFLPSCASIPTTSGVVAPEDRMRPIYVIYEPPGPLSISIIKNGPASITTADRELVQTQVGQLVRSITRGMRERFVLLARANNVTVSDDAGSSNTLRISIDKPDAICSASCASSLSMKVSVTSPSGKVIWSYKNWLSPKAGMGYYSEAVFDLFISSVFFEMRKARLIPDQSK